MPPVVVIGMPARSRRDVNQGAADSQKVWPLLNGNAYRVIAVNRYSSLLTYSFNRLWCAALNLIEAEDAQYFAMIHSDVVAAPGWAETLIEEMNRVDADMLSVAIPLKSPEGLTSTALSDPRTIWNSRRITMHELFKLPETFTIDDVPWREENSTLLLNTGLWVCRLDRPWVKQGVVFRQYDDIRFNTIRQEFEASTASEDWNWSRDLVERGAKLACTRKVVVEHEESIYHNREPWGTSAVDLEWVKYMTTQSELAAQAA